MYLKAQGEDIRDVIENGSFVPTTIINNVEQIKVKISWNNEDKKKVLYDNKEKNIVASELDMDEFFRVSNYKTTKDI